MYTPTPTYCYNSSDQHLHLLDPGQGFLQACFGRENPSLKITYTKIFLAFMIFFMMLYFCFVGCSGVSTVDSYSSCPQSPSSLPPKGEILQETRQGEHVGTHPVDLRTILDLPNTPHVFQGSVDVGIQDLHFSSQTSYW